MINFKDVQTHAYDLIKVATSFAGSPLKAIKDDGHQHDAEQALLRTAGYHATVLPLLDADLIGEGAGASIIDAGLAIRVAVNPAITPTPDAYALIREVKQTLTSWDPPKNEAERYRVADKAFIIDDTDPGEIAYILFFTKRCVF